MRLPDASGKIRRAKRRISKACAVMKSPFCEEIIALRLQGWSYRKIETWLIDKGEQHRIAAPTLFRNLKPIRQLESLPMAEMLAEDFGGLIEIDPAREVARSVLLQRRRVETW